LQGGGAASFSADMERGNQRWSLLLRILVLEVPALKIGACFVFAAEKSHNLLPQIQFFLNLGISYEVCKDFLYKF
jgi:hypothetical protein